MDAITQTPPSYEQVITQKLIKCGLSAAGVHVSYQDYLRSFEVVISSSAKTAPSMFQCIHEVAKAEIVTFNDQELRSQYQAFLADVYRPEALARAEADLAKRGLLQGFPKRADFTNDTFFAEALEDLCGLSKGEVIRPIGNLLAFQPPLEAMRDFDTFSKRYACLLSAIQLVNARGELEIGFVGNDTLAPGD